MRHTTWVLFGSETETVEAEYEGLEDTRLAVVVYPMSEAILYNHPQADLELAFAITGALRRAQQEGKLKDLRIIDPRRVAGYLQRDLQWEALPKDKLAERLGAKHLLLVTITEFSTREPGSLHLYRGRVSGEAALYQAGLEDERAMVWHTRDAIRVEHPKDRPVGNLGEDDTAVRRPTEALFALKLARKFYDHKEKVQP
jgi:hypothetical protein